MNITYSKKFKPTSKKKEINNINIDPSIRKEMAKSLKSNPNKQ